MVDRIEELKAANERLQRRYEVADLNFQKFQGQWKEAQAQLDGLRDEFYPVLRKYGLLSDVGWAAYYHPGGMVDAICQRLRESRIANRKLRTENRLLRASQPEEIRTVAVDAIREIRAERRKWLLPPEPDLVETLLKKLKRLRYEIRTAQEMNEHRNQQLDALHFVWCDGGCESGVHRYGDRSADDITLEMVQEARRSVSRLERWYANREFKKKAKE